MPSHAPKPLKETAGSRPPRAGLLRYKATVAALACKFAPGALACWPLLAAGRTTSLERLAACAGFEPATLGATGRCSKPTELTNLGNEKATSRVASELTVNSGLDGLFQSLNRAGALDINPVPWCNTAADLLAKDIVHPQSVVVAMFTRWRNLKYHCEPGKVPHPVESKGQRIPELDLLNGLANNVGECGH